jgi:hypothetical protein
MRIATMTSRRSTNTDSAQRPAFRRNAPTANDKLPRGQGRSTQALYAPAKQYYHRRLSTLPRRIAARGATFMHIADIVLRIPD